MSYGNYPDLSAVRRILVIKLRHLGDVLLTTPVFTNLKKNLPQAEIDAYVYREAMPMLEGHPAISEIIEYDRNWKKLGLFRRLAKEFQILQRIHKKRYDLVINLTEGDRGAMAARWSRAGIRVGVDSRKIYTHAAKNCPSLRHAVERQLDVLRRIGLFPSEDEKELVLTVSPDVQLAASSRVPFSSFILIHPTSRWRFKCWPVEKTVALAQELIRLGERLVFTSGPDPEEMAMVEAMVARLPKESVCNLAGLISLKELAALVHQAKATICFDSVPLHIASALKAKVVALFGPTSEINWGSWQNPHARMIVSRMSCRPCYQDGCGGSKKSECLEKIEIQQVISELKVIAEIGAPCVRIADELVPRS